MMVGNTATAHRSCQGTDTTSYLGVADYLLQELSNSGHYNHTELASDKYEFQLWLCGVLFLLRDVLIESKGSILCERQMHLKYERQKSCHCHLPYSALCCLLAAVCWKWRSALHLTTHGRLGRIIIYQYLKATDHNLKVAVSWYLEQEVALLWGFWCVGW